MYGERTLQSARRNPFYLLSALSMLLGCFALSQHLTLIPGQWKPLVSLIGVLQVYEFLLLGLALYLNRRAHARADAATAFLLGLLFLVDATHINAELAASNPWVAPWVATVLLALAAIKLCLLRDALGLRSRRALAVTLAQLGLLLFLPGTVSAVHFMDGKVHALGLGPEALPRVILGFWWLVGCIPIACLWAHREREDGGHPSAQWIGQALLMLPFGSIVVHYIALHWLYRLPFHASYATPLLLGMSTYASFSFARRLDRFQLLLRCGVPVSAILFSSNGPEVWTLTWSGLDLVLSPLRVALAGLALVWYLHRVVAGEKAFGWAAGGSLLLALSGHSASSIGNSWVSFVPENGAELGFASIIAAFAFLALGMARSLLPPTAGDKRRVIPTR